jgi:hypothetical protein
MFKLFLKYILLLPAILSVLLTSPQIQAATPCNSTATGNWSTVSWSCGHVPLPADDVVISTTVTLNQNVAVNQIHLAGTLNASNFTITLTATEPIFFLVVFSTLTSAR